MRCSMLHRSTVLVAMVSLISVGLASCSDGDGTGSDDAGYPVSIDGPYGAVQIDHKPEHVIAVTRSMGDYVSSLGVTPEAVGGSSSSSNMPWTSELDSLVVEDLNVKPGASGMNIEKMSEYEPDLVVGDKYSVDSVGEWEKANSIAPMFAGITDNSGTAPLEPTLEAVSKLLYGDTKKAKEVSDSIDAAFSDARSLNPSYSGKSYQFGQVTEDGWISGNGEILQRFGMVPDENQVDSNRETISAENFGNINADYVIAVCASSELCESVRSNDLFANSSNSANRKVAWLDLSQDENLPFVFALNDMGPSSAKWVASNFPKLFI